MLFGNPIFQALSNWRKMNIRQTYKLFALAIALFFIVMGSVVFRLLTVQNEIAENERRRFISYRLIIEMYNSSEELTRMARSYVVTGDPVYEQRYHEILAIRNGERPRPELYSVTYWHLSGRGDNRPFAGGETVPLRELMKREMTHRELDLVGKSLDKSDQLVAMEEQAFAAVKGLYDDGNGNFTVPGTPDRDYAIRLLFSDKYFEEKARIMEPLQQCIQEINTRITAMLRENAIKVRQNILLVLALVLLALLGIEMKVVHVFRKILHPLDLLRKRMTDFKSGRYDVRCEVLSANEIGEACVLFNNMAESLETDILMRKRAEATLKRSEEQVRLLLNSVAEGVYGIDIQGNCTWVNPSCLSMLGYSDASQLLGKNMHQLIRHSYPDKRPMPNEMCRIYRAFRKGESVSVDDEVLWKADGSSFPVEYFSCPQVADGKIIGAVVTFTDITRRKQAEAELAREYENLKNIFERLPFGVVIIGRDQIIRWANAAACKMAGVTSSDEMQARPCGEYLCPAQQHECPILDKRRTIDTSEKILRRKDGQNIPVIKTVIEMRLQGEDVLLESFVDISWRKEAEAALAKERQKLANILEGTNAGTWEWNVQTGETDFNERWAEIIGYKLAELQPVSIETWSKYAHPDDLKASGALLEKHFRKELPYYECELRMLHKDGSWVWVLDRGKVATWTPDGKPLIMSGTHQDITVGKVAQERIEYLERIFLHDIMNTAVALRGFSDLIISGGSDKDMEKKILPSISLLSNRIIDEISAHRELMAAEQKNLTVTRVKLNSLSFLSEIQSLYQAEILGGRSLKMDKASQSVDFACDKTLLSRVIGNMIKNAVEASLPGQTITMGCFEKEGRVHFWVHNPGYMPANVQAQLFRRSFSTKGVGRGLGAYSMKVLTEQYLQGRISFVSTEENGTTFTAEYPVS